MTYLETLYHLQCWEAAVQPCNETAELLLDLFDGQYDSPMFKPYQHLIEEYTKLVAKVIGDECEWLQYYQYDCNWGAKPMEVTMSDAEKIMLDSLPKLAKIISTP
jgi:hypothetical protein